MIFILKVFKRVLKEPLGKLTGESIYMESSVPLG